MAPCDSYAATDKFYPGDKWDRGYLRGNFRQLQHLKKKHPLRVISFKRGNKTELFPDTVIKLQRGDTLSVLATLEIVKAIEEENGTG